MKLSRYLTFASTLLALELSMPTPATASEFLLVDVNGSAQIKRSGQSQYQSARGGMRLNIGDLVRTEGGAQVRIRCSDLTTTWTMNSNIERGVVWGCPPDGGFSLRVGRQSDNTLGGIDPTLPYIVTPRRTVISDPQPMLRWNPVAGASRYTVQVIGSDVTWETEVSGTQVQYPGTPPLTPGVDYRVIVEADTGASSQLDVGSETATFELLYPEDLDLVAADVAQIREQGFPEETEALAIADIYIREDLLTEAIATLEPFVASGTQTLEVYQALGDIYRYIGLNLLAEERYERAIAIATSNEEIQALADARSGLAEVKVLLEQPQAAIDLLMQAQSGYERLNDTERIQELQARIDDLT